MTYLPLAIQAAQDSVLGPFKPLLIPLIIWAVSIGWGMFGMAKHPKGLNPLFFTEMWERFSYYGMRALLLLYMRLPESAGGLGLSLPVAGSIYAFYTFFVYALSVPGGWIADRFLGYRKAVLVGGVMIALGEFGLASGPKVLFFAGLAAIALGTGLLKTNCTSLVGMLYEENDPRQDAGYSVYYMGINIGALISPLILGYMAQDPAFVSGLSRLGLGNHNGWRLAFGFAGAAMVAGLIQYSLRQHVLGDVGLKPNAVPSSKEEQDRITQSRAGLPASLKRMFYFTAAISSLNLLYALVAMVGQPLMISILLGINGLVSAWVLYACIRLNKTAVLVESIRAFLSSIFFFVGVSGLVSPILSIRIVGGLITLGLAILYWFFYSKISTALNEVSDLTEEERSRMWVVGILMFFIMTFFFVFEQAGTTLNLFADDHTLCAIGSWTFPSTWFQSVNSIWLLILAPVIGWLWLSLGKKEPSSPAKFTLGLFLVGAGMLVLVVPSLAYTANPALKVSPWWLVSVYLLHTVGELCLSPVGLSTTSKLAPARYSGLMMGCFFFAIGAGNLLAGFAGGFSEKLAPATLFGGLFVITTVMALILVVLSPRIKRMMGGVH
ncbi:MAG TPA: oligopeptide:H+ symporter [Holophagaceae bacterium]|nr:oligopeptide:H+ symporter [Holophagaceae bacterium]